MNTPDFMRGADIDAAMVIHPTDIITSLKEYALNGGIIIPATAALLGAVSVRLNTAQS